MHLYVGVGYVSWQNPTLFFLAGRKKNEAVLLGDLALVAVVITSNCRVITAPQAACLNVFWLNANDWLRICPCG